MDINLEIHWTCCYTHGNRKENCGIHQHTDHRLHPDSSAYNNSDLILLHSHWNVQGYTCRLQKMTSSKAFFKHIYFLTFTKFTIIIITGIPIVYQIATLLWQQ